MTKSVTTRSRTVEWRLRAPASLSTTSSLWFTTIRLEYLIISHHISQSASGRRAACAALPARDPERDRGSPPPHIPCKAGKRCVDTLYSYQITILSLIILSQYLIATIAPPQEVCISISNFKDNLTG